MINFVSITLDGMPYMPMHLPVLNALGMPWRWTVVSGVSAATNCTSWCKSIEPRLPEDGTHEFMLSLSSHPRITYIRKPFWNGGKVEMFNAALAMMKEPGLLWQMDCDEIWTAQQIETMYRAFELSPAKSFARFWCRYYLGPNIVTTTRWAYGNNASEWLRVWRFKPGDTFLSHEPPHLSSQGANGFTQDETEKLGCVFQHFAYHNYDQVMFKEKFYGYDRAGQHWLDLQANKTWPTKVGNFLPWVKDFSECDLLVK